MTRKYRHPSNGTTMQRVLIGLTAGLVTALASSVVSAVGPWPADRIAGIGVEGSAFRIHLRSGRTLSNDELIGATLKLRMSAESDPATVYVESIQTDADDPDREITLYHLLAVDAATGAKHELCGPDARGEHWAFPLAGQWDAAGRHQTNSGYTLTCADGAQGKCVRFGYKPWKTLADGTRLADYHQACVHLVRAAYCGNGPATETGTLIDLFDTVGILKPDPKSNESGLRFEAAWNTRGAVCVAHTRVPKDMTISALTQSCPRLRDRIGVDRCTEESASYRGEPVLLFNRSR